MEALLAQIPIKFELLARSDCFATKLKIRPYRRHQMGKSCKAVQDRHYVEAKTLT